MRNKVPILILAATLVCGRAFPYSHDGHYLVGAIADQMLAGTPTAGKVKALIGNVSLATAANLADEIKSWDHFNSHPFKVTTNRKLNKDLKAFLQANLTQSGCSTEP